MERSERVALVVLVLVAVLFNIVTLTPLIPWQTWLLWSQPTPTKTFNIQMENYQIELPPQGIAVNANEYVQFIATSKDVTYGLGVFRADGTIVFQMQVLPGRENKIPWKFDTAGNYDIRSTEYSGPRHSEMFVKNAIVVAQ